MIKLVNICKSFDREVLSNITLEFELGKIYLLKGISGCGKTTLLNIIAGIDKDYTGNYLYNNINTKDLSKRSFDRIRDNIGYITQDSMLIGHLSVYDNLTLIVNDKKLIYDLADRFNIKEILKKKPSQLSGGERQRVAVIRALLKNCDVIIADEPTASLDINNAKEFVKCVETLRQMGKLVIVSSHKKIYDEIADKIINITFGKCKSDEQVLPNNPENNDVNSQKALNVINNKRKASSLISTLRYMLDGKFGIKRILVIIAITLLMFSITMSIAISNNFEEAYTTKYAKDNKFHVIESASESKDKIKNSGYDIFVYENYCIFDEAYCVYPLFHKEDSRFYNNNVIDYGIFPENREQVIVNYNYVNSILKTDDYESVIGKKIQIKDNTYEISAVFDANSNNKIYKSNSFYTNIGVDVFMPYDTIIKVGELIPSETIMCAYPKKENGRKADIELNITTREIKLQIELNQAINEVEGVTTLILICIFALILVSIIFVINQVSIELFYKKCSIGYLQMFGIKKRKVKHMLLCNYIFNMIIADAIAVSMYFIVNELIKTYIGYDFTLDINILLMINGLSIIYILLVTYIPITHFLRKPIIKLISNNN